MINLTLIGNAVYMSMDIPDIVLAVRHPKRRSSVRLPAQGSKLLNYIQWTTAKFYAFATFMFVWT